MQTLVSEIFGTLILLSSIALVVWEVHAQRNATPHDHWLITSKRYRRRMVMAVCLALVGIVMLLEVIGVIDLHSLRPLLFYVTTLGFATILLVMLALADMLETTRNLHEQEIRDFTEPDQSPEPKKSESPGSLES